jgi:hypothetical protein
LIRTLGIPLFIAFAAVAGSRIVSADQYTLDWVRADVFGRAGAVQKVVVNSDDEPVVAGTSGVGLATVASFSESGEIEWTTPAYATANLEDVAGMAVDSMDHVFIAGTTYRYGSDAFLVKYAPQGAVLWERHLGRFGRDVTVDSAGFAYVLGSTERARSSDDTFVAKYSPSGDLVSMRRYENDPYGVLPYAIDEHDGDLFFLGSYRHIASTLTRLNEAGEIAWQIQPDYASTAGKVTQLYDVVVDSAGNIFTCGFTEAVNDGAIGYKDADAVLAKHASDGTLQWQRRLNTGEIDALTSIQVDGENDVYVTGYRSGGQSLIGGDLDAVWAKFSSEGDLLWQQQFDNTLYQAGTSISVDSRRNVFLTTSGEGQLVVRYNFQIPEPSTAGFAAGIAAFAFVRRSRIRGRRMNSLFGLGRRRNKEGLLAEFSLGASSSRRSAPGSRARMA